jgi:predicted metal-dependent peptidase
MNQQAQKQMKNALTGLMLEGQEFFASLALRMPLVQDLNIETCTTNGQMIRYNPDYVLKLSRDAQKALLCHEVMHVACGHMWRIDLRDPAKANLAMDYAINPLIAATKGMTLPPGYLVDAQYAGMPFEQIYRLLPDQPGGGGNDQPGGGGQDVQPSPGDSNPDPDGNGMTEQDWKQAIMQAAKQAQQQGVMPAGFERLLNQIKYPACRDLVAALLEFCSRTARDDYSFRRPNKKHIARGLVLPELYSVTCPPIVACVDTSGSVYDELLEDYRGALQRVLDECKPETLAVISCDSAIHSVAEYAEGDLVVGKFPGGGGTSFVPALERAAEYEPTAAVYFTDTYGEFPDEPPTFPVLWCVFDSAGDRRHVPANMGECIFLE